jgi:hypothetical protein
VTGRQAACFPHLVLELLALAAVAEKHGDILADASN